MSTLKTNNLQLLDQSRTIAVSKLAEMNGGFSFRNKIVDGRFDFWYEGTSQTTSGYGSSTMWANGNVGSIKVHSQQTLVAGVDLPAIDCPSAKYFSRTVVTSVAGANNYVVNWHRIEDVRTLAGKTATLSFYAKADTIKNISLGFSQNFGSGGSTQINTLGQLVSINTVWNRYSLQFTFPSISGKTIGSGSYLVLSLALDLGSSISGLSPHAALGQQSGTFDIACVQLEEGTVATPFEELPVSVSEQRLGRYYQHYKLDIDTPIGYNPANAAVSQVFMRNVPMRTIPTMTPTTQNGAGVKSIGGGIKATSTSMNAYHGTHFYYDI